MCKGTAIYCAPELLRCKYSFKADVWSAGVIVSATCNNHHSSTCCMPNYITMTKPTDVMGIVEVSPCSSILLGLHMRERDWCELMFLLVSTKVLALKPVLVAGHKLAFCTCLFGGHAILAHLS